MKFQKATEFDFVDNCGFLFNECENSTADTWESKRLNTLKLIETFGAPDKWQNFLTSSHEIWKTIT